MGTTSLTDACIHAACDNMRMQGMDHLSHQYSYHPGCNRFFSIKQAVFRFSLETSFLGLHGLTGFPAFKQYLPM